MRPAILFPLFHAVSSLKAVGPKSKEALARLLPAKPVLGLPLARHEPTVRDLLFHLPSGVVDRTRVTTIAQAAPDSVCTLNVMVESHHAPLRRGGRKTPYKVIVSDESGDMVIAFFNAKPDYIATALPAGTQRIISGTIEIYDGVRQMTHPDVIALPEKLHDIARLEPTYPLTYAMTQRQLRMWVDQALQKLPDLPEWIDESFLQQRGWKSWKQSLAALHRPQTVADALPDSLWLNRLVYDEILANQLALAMIRARSKKQAGVKLVGECKPQQQLLASLPYQLTLGQQQVVSEIEADLASGDRMLRLLQGDVGSGKTIVALVVAMRFLAADYQCALMVPTDVLGRQHAKNIMALLEPLGFRVAYLSGKLTAKERAEIKQQIEEGSIHFVIGTHALFQEDVTFATLGLVIIDEQHRFGVNQRLALSAKGTQPHVLLMTATPIPRSLTLTAYGDMDASALIEKPASRPKIQTSVVPLGRTDEVIAGIRRALETGAKIYWICPLVQAPEDEAVKEDEGDIAAAVERFHVLKTLLGDGVELAHGQMPVAQRNEAMNRFAHGDAKVLVATTVVEVGVDVPDATIIVIEHAERFGLAQLHQLRGRVGRGSKPSSCVLLYQERISEVARKRLKIMRESDDGFYIAEEDLILRGAGDVLGTRQSGMPDFRFVDLARHRELVLAARDDVKLILHRDPTLQTPRGQALRCLLYLFDYDQSLSWMLAG